MSAWHRSTRPISRTNVDLLYIDLIFTLRNKLKWNLNQNTKLFIQEKACKNVFFRISTILFQPQYVLCCVTSSGQGLAGKSCWPSDLYENFVKSNSEKKTTTWTSLSIVQERQLNLITHSDRVKWYVKCCWSWWKVAGLKTEGATSVSNLGCQYCTFYALTAPLHIRIDLIFTWCVYVSFGGANLPHDTTKDSAGARFTNE